MKIIFLDKDGVLNSDEYFDKIKELTIDVGLLERDVDIEKLKLLKKATDETGAKIVLTASARYTRGCQPLIQYLENNHMLQGLTPDIDNIRGKEIKQWLSEHPDAEDFVILDDEIFDSYDEELKKKLIKISDGNGINLGEGVQQKDIEQIIERLGKVKKRDEEER